MGQVQGNKGEQVCPAQGGGLGRADPVSMAELDISQWVPKPSGPRGPRNSLEPAAGP